MGKGVEAARAASIGGFASVLAACGGAAKYKRLCLSISALRSIGEGARSIILLEDESDQSDLSDYSDLSDGILGLTPYDKPVGTYFLSH